MWQELLASSEVQSANFDLLPKSSVHNYSGGFSFIPRIQYDLQIGTSWANSGYWIYSCGFGLPGVVKCIWGKLRSELLWPVVKPLCLELLPNSSDLN